MILTLVAEVQWYQKRKTEPHGSLVRGSLHSGGIPNTIGLRLKESLVAPAMKITPT